MSLLLRSSKLTAQTIRSASHLPKTPITQNFNFVRGFKSTTANMGVHNLASKSEFESAIKNNKIVVLDAFATWCGPCKVIAPQVHKFSDDFPGAYFVKLDVDEVPDVAQELGIRAMPTFLIFQDGEKTEEIVGANPKKLLAAIEAAVKA